MIRRTLIAALTAALLLGVAGVAAAKAPSSHSLKVIGVVRSLNPVRGTVTVAVRHKVGRAHRVRTRLMTFGLAHAQVSGQGGAIAVGERVTVTFDGHSPDQASNIVVLGRPNGGDGGKGAAFVGVISAVSTSSDTFTVASPDGSSGSGVIVQATGTTVFAVPGAADGGQSGLADLNVGDRVVVFTNDATAVPVVAIALLDMGNAPHKPPPPPPNYQAINGMVTAVSTSSQTLTLLTPASGHGNSSRGDGPGGGVQAVTVGVTASTQFAGQNPAGQVHGLADMQVGDLVTVKAAVGTSGGTATALVVYDHGQPPSTGNMNHVIGSVTVVDSTAGMVTLTVNEGPQTGQTVTAVVNAHTKLFVGDPTGHATLADVKTGDRVGVGFTGDFASQVTAAILYDMSNPPAGGH